MNRQDIKMIENRNKEDIIKILKDANLGINRRIGYQDYSIAKKLIFQGHFIDSDIYDKQISWICEYLKI